MRHHFFQLPSPASSFVSQIFEIVGFLWEWFPARQAAFHFARLCCSVCGLWAFLALFISRSIIIMAALLQ
jgi:hypothetical protein